jgi:hypothetical protein
VPRRYAEDSGQRSDNSSALAVGQRPSAREVTGPATMRADVAVTATLDAVCVVSPASTAEGCANQCAELRADIHALPDPWGSSMAQKWDPFITRVEAEYRGRGRDAKVKREALKYVDDTKANWADPGAPIPHTLIHETSEVTGYSVDRLKKALRERGDNIERRDKKKGHNAFRRT